MFKSFIGFFLFILTIFSLSGCNADDKNTVALGTSPMQTGQYSKTEQYSEGVTQSFTETSKPAQEIAPTKGNEQTNKKTAQEFVEEITAGWNVGNTLDSFGMWINSDKPEDFETAWGNPKITPQLIRFVKELGFNTVRVPVTYAQHIDSNDNIDRAWLTRVKEVVDYCISEDMYCIINIHHDTGAGDVVWLRADAGMFNAGMAYRYEKVWEQIADFFKEYDNRLVFEGFNEILDINSNWGGSDSLSYDTVNRLNQIFVDTVRKSGGNNSKRNIIVNAYGASNYTSQLDGFVLPKDSAEGHILASVHIYSPMNFCDGNDSSFDNEDVQEINEAFKRVHDKLIQRFNIPVIVGECGVVNKINTYEFSKEIAKYCGCMAENAKQYNMACIFWDNGGDMSLIDRKNLSAKENEAIQTIMKIVK